MIDKVKSSLASAGVSAGAGLLSAGINAAFNRWNLKQQNKFAKEQFQWQVDRDNWLMLNQPTLTKQGLKNAGYSVSDPNGVGAQITGMDSPGAHAPSGTFMPFADMAANYASIRNASAQADLAEANAKIANIEAQNRQDVISANIDKVRTDIDAIKNKLPEEVNLLKAQANSAASQAKYNDKQVQYLDKDIERVGELINGIRIDNSYKGQLNDAQIMSLVASAYQANQNGKWQGFLNELAQHGIIAGQDGWTNLFNIILNHPDIAGKLIEGVEKLTESIPGVGKVVKKVAKLARSGVQTAAEYHEGPGPGSVPPSPLDKVKAYAKAREEWMCKKAHVSSVADIPRDRYVELLEQYNKSHPMFDEIGY